MIWLCGDTHGELDIRKVKRYFAGIKENVEITKNDYLIILGDAGICWDGGRKDESVQRMLHDLPCSVLWLDGNHENFDRITVFPVERWHGGNVQFIREDIIHLMRGQVYSLNEKKIFTFGGAYSIDKSWRIPGVSWWPEEMPSRAEYEEGLKNLGKVKFQVDYVLTHTCPENIAHLLVPKVLPGEEELQTYFEELAVKLSFQKWYFGHWHVDQAHGKFRCLWEDIISID